LTCLWEITSYPKIGRGFDVEIGVPFNESINDGLKKVAETVADACPTGALGSKKSTF
jgi:NADH dehydrogenase/NADH:ubiquinone oxidoreductase subunit G